MLPVSPDRGRTFCSFSLWFPSPVCIFVHLSFLFRRWLVSALVHACLRSVSPFYFLFRSFFSVTDFASFRIVFVKINTVFILGQFLFDRSWFQGHSVPFRLLSEEELLQFRSLLTEQVLCRFRVFCIGKFVEYYRVFVKERLARKVFCTRRKCIMSWILSAFFFVQNKNHQNSVSLSLPLSPHDINKE